MVDFIGIVLLVLLGPFMKISGETPRTSSSGTGVRLGRVVIGGYMSCTLTRRLKVFVGVLRQHESIEKQD